MMEVIPKAVAPPKVLGEEKASALVASWRQEPAQLGGDRGMMPVSRDPIWQLSRSTLMGS